MGILGCCERLVPCACRLFRCLFLSVWVSEAISPPMAMTGTNSFQYKQFRYCKEDLPLSSSSFIKVSVYLFYLRQQVNVTWKCKMLTSGRLKAAKSLRCVPFEEIWGCLKAATCYFSLLLSSLSLPVIFKNRTQQLHSAMVLLNMLQWLDVYHCH